ncbi:zinc ribbon domain-containing protein [Clostridium sp. LBM24168]
MLDILIQIQENIEILKNSDERQKNGEAFNHMKKIKKEFEKEKKNHVVLKEKLDNIKKDIKIIDARIEDIKIEIREEENKLYSNLKYDLKLMNSLGKSIEMKKMEIKNVEDKSLELLYEEDELSKQKDKSKNKLIEMRDDFYKCKETYNNEILKKRKKVREAEQNITNLEKMVPKELLDKFYEILKARGTGAAQLDKGICQGCRMKVSAITLDDINKNKGIVYCDNCGRIIHCNY